MDLQSPRIPTRSSKEKAIDFDLLQLADATSVTTLSTHQELYNLIVKEQLVPGSWYKFPYRSVNFINGWLNADNNTSGIHPSYDPIDIYTGPEEMLIVQAISTNRIAENAYSEQYPQDIINFNPLVNKLGVSIDVYNGITLPNSSIVSGFDLQWDGTNAYFDMPTGYPVLFGQFFYFYCQFDDGMTTYDQDGSFANVSPSILSPDYSYYPNPSRIQIVNNGTRVLLLDLTQVDVNNYVSNSLYIDTIREIDNAYGWITRRIDTYRNISVPFDFRGRKYRRYETEIFGCINQNGFSWAYSGTGAAGGLDNFYATIPVYLVSGTGQGAMFSVDVVAGVVVDVRIVSPGRFYQSGDSVLIAGSSIGGVDGADDIAITISIVESEIGYYAIGTEITDNYLGAFNVPSDVYNDFPCLGNDDNFYDIYWEGIGAPYMYGGLGSAENNIFSTACNSAKIANGFYNNTIGDAININVKYYAYGNIILNFINLEVGSCNYNTARIISNSRVLKTFEVNVITGSFKYNNIDQSSSNRIVGDIQYNNIVSMSSNSIFNNFELNTIENGFSNNAIGMNFKNNVIGNDFASNRIQNDFASNSIRNYFVNNLIRDGFGFGGFAERGNTIGNRFTMNTIGEYFYDNVVADSFSANKTNDYFQLNNIKANYVSGIDFLTATHVYGSYNCDIFKRNDNSLRLSFVDNTDVVNYTNIDA